MARDPRMGPIHPGGGDRLGPPPVVGTAVSTEEILAKLEALAAVMGFVWSDEYGTFIPQTAATATGKPARPLGPEIPEPVVSPGP